MQPGSDASAAGQFDYIAIGAGAAGAVLANRLSDDTSTRVCLLEAGPRDRPPYIHLPARFIMVMDLIPECNGEHHADRSEMQRRRRVADCDAIEITVRRVTLHVPHPQ